MFMSMSNSSSFGYNLMADYGKLPFTKHLVILVTAVTGGQCKECDQGKPSI